MRKHKQFRLRAIDCERLGFEVVFINNEDQYSEAKKNAEMLSNMLGPASLLGKVPEHHALTYKHIADVTYDGIEFSCYGDAYKGEAIVYEFNYKGVPFDGSHFFDKRLAQILQDLINDLDLGDLDFLRSLNRG